MASGQQPFSRFESMNKIPVAIFLDFDGVFHPYFSSDQEKFQDVPNFQKVLENYSDKIDFNIVISSSWKKRKSLDEIKAIFPKFISDKIVSKTPNFKDEDGSRLAEAKEWLSNVDIQHWIAIDDDSFAWNKCENLVWCMDKFQEDEAESLSFKLDCILKN